MGSQETVFKEPNKFSKSVGAGVKSLMGGGGKTYYILEHKVSSEKHHAGEKQEIIIDYIELGRDSACQVNFGSTFPTVSRKHAAITKEGNNWVIKQLSQNNPTLINGRPIAKQWFLQNGDEIKLSVEGPKIGFLIPSNPTVGSIGFTRRLSLFRQQALRPYKQAITFLAILFVLGLGASGFFIWKQTGKIADLENVAATQANEIISTRKQNEKIVSDLKGQIKNIKMNQEAVRDTHEPPPPPPPLIDKLYSSVFYVKCTGIKVTFTDGTSQDVGLGWSGTGFLLNDGRFITARHVVEPWYFISKPQDDMAKLNAFIQLGAKVEYTLNALSPDGTRLELNGNNFIKTNSSDATKQLPDGNIVKVAVMDGTDWAYIPTNKKGLLRMDASLSSNLTTQNILHILGYPLSLGATNPNDISPLYSKTQVSRDGLHDGLIYITSKTFDHGNSGGPVMYLKENEYIAVGIVSAGVGDAVGLIVPVSSIK